MSFEFSGDDVLKGLNEAMDSITLTYEPDIFDRLFDLRIDRDPYAIKKIITNDNAVIVFWEDGDKTVVKKMDSDNDDVYSAVAQALAKKIYGSTTHFHKVVDKKMSVQIAKAKK